MSQENSIELKWLVQVFRRRIWLILICALLAGASAFTVTSLLPPSYKATAILLIDQAGLAGSSQYNDILASERVAGTYSEMLVGRSVLEAAAAQLGGGMTAAALTKKVEARPVPSTQLIQLSVKGDDPTQTVLLADTIADVFAAQMQTFASGRFADSLKVLQTRVNQLAALVKKTEGRMETLQQANREADSEYARQEALLQDYRSRYEVAQQDYEELQLNSALAARDVLVVEQSSLADDAVLPRELYTAVATLLGAAAAFALSLLLERVDDTIKTTEDVVQTLGLDVFGAIPPVRGGESLTALNAPRSASAEALRVLGANIRFSGLDALRTLLVTSPGTQEGKSTLAANLAVTMAQAELDVVLVDADLHFSRLHQLFNLTVRNEGLSGVLRRGDAKPRPCPVAVKGLALLPGGVTPYNPIQLLDSRRMKDLLDQLSWQANLVVIDSPPVLPLVDATILAQMVDGVLLVIRSGRTRRKAALEAVKGLRQVGARLVGVVLTAAPVAQGSYSRYYQESCSYAERWPLRRRQWKRRLATVPALFRKQE